MRFIDIRRNIQLELYRLIRGPSFAVHGVSVEVPRSVGIELRYNLMRERYENDEAELIRKYVSRGCNVVELGGSLGIVSRVIRDTIGPGAVHIVVEANPDLVEICAQNAIVEP